MANDVGKIIIKGAFKRKREHAESAEGWKRSIYNTTGIIHLLPPPGIQP